MYCVKCGVRLQDGVNTCPLCSTPVWNPEQPEEKFSYPDHYPRIQEESRLPFAVTMTVISVVAIVVILIICLKLNGVQFWGGYVIGGTMLLYIIAVLPRWFHHIFRFPREHMVLRPASPEKGDAVRQPGSHRLPSDQVIPGLEGIPLLHD